VTEKRERIWSVSEQLAGKVAVITGGASGIGLATVELFAEQGAKVVVGDILVDQSEALGALLGSDVVGVHTDVTDCVQVEALVRTAVDHFGRLDVMFNNAAAAGDPSPILELSAEGLEQTLRLVVGSVVYGHRFAAKQFIAQGTPGSIITTASGASFQGGWSSAGYTIGKHAVLGVVRQAAGEFGPYGIRTNAIAPGITLTPIMSKTFGLPPSLAHEFTEHLAERLSGQQALGRVGHPRDLALAALFLASDASAWVTGTVLPVDGGLVSVTHSTLMPDLLAAAEAFAADHGISRS
jgi:NAD(P)-dependent dehydrogenase (short-subunit alcohol dehydrogenase family)